MFIDDVRAYLEHAELNCGVAVAFGYRGTPNPRAVQSGIYNLSFSI